MIVVRVHEHDHPVSHPIEDFPCLIGRSLKSAIRIDEPTVSARHAELRQDEGGYLLVDLGSTNGITRAGARVQEVRIEANETVFVGDVKVELVVEEELPKTKLNRLSKEPLLGTARHEIPRVLATLILSYVGLTLVPAADVYKEYWPPERPYELLGSALALWGVLLGLAFVISLFCKLNSKRFHFRQVMALMVATFLVARFFLQLAPTLIFNLHNFAPAPLILHWGYGVLAFGFFYQLQQYTFHRWGQRLRAVVAGGAALAVILLVEVYVDARKGYGDRDRMTDLGLPLLDPKGVDRSPDDLLFDVALKVAESDQNRIRILEKREADKD